MITLKKIQVSNDMITKFKKLVFNFIIFYKKKYS